ncbi:MAG: ABC transporter ATP-binding protein, partial [Actinomycetota bacterium]
NDGRVVLDDDVLDDVSAGVHRPAEQRQIGVIFQDLLLFPHLDVLENVAFPLRARSVPADAARKRAQAALEQVGVGTLSRAKPSTLSGGQSQCVALARALAPKPRLLLLDEPLAALDVSAKTRIRAVLRRVLTGFKRTAIIVTHDPVDAMTLADRIVVIEGGRVTQIGTAAELRAAPRTRYAADLVGVNLFVGRLAIEGGAALIHTPDGDVFCDPPEETTAPVDGAMGIVRPADVSLFLERPAGSARNLFPGPISFITIEGERARVGVGSAPPVVAEITGSSLSRLALVEGMNVWASFKALEVRVVLP